LVVTPSMMPMAASSRISATSAPSMKNFMGLVPIFRLLTAFGVWRAFL
jgi:hypothetical protein